MATKQPCSTANFCFTVVAATKRAGDAAPHALTARTPTQYAVSALRPASVTIWRLPGAPGAGGVSAGIPSVKLASSSGRPAR